VFFIFYILEQFENVSSVVLRRIGEYALVDSLKNRNHWLAAANQCRQLNQNRVDLSVVDGFIAICWRVMIGRTRLGQTQFAELKQNRRTKCLPICNKS